MQDRREMRRAGSRERDERHKSSGGGAYLNIPAGVELFIPESKSYKIDFSLYTVGKHNPFCRDAGALYYELTFFVHKNVGPNNDTYCCPNKMRKERCPICEYRSQIERKGCPDGTDRKEWWKKNVSPFGTSERQLWLPHVRGGDDPEKVQLYDVSNFGFGKLLDALRQKASEDDTYKTDFDDPTAGSYLECTYSDEKFGEGGGTWTKCISIQFIPRAKGMNPALLEHGINLEAIPIVPTFEELKKAFLQTGDDDDETKGSSEKAKSNDWEDELAKTQTAKKAPEKREEKTEPVKQTIKPAPGVENEAAKAGLEEGQVVRHRQYGKCEIRRISNDGTSLTLIGEDDEIHKACAVADVRPWEKKAEEAPKPAKKEEAPWEGEPEKVKTETKTEKPSDEWDDSPSKKAPVKAAKSSDDWD